jgi:hypothetical protein
VLALILSAWKKQNSLSKLSRVIEKPDLKRQSPEPIYETQTNGEYFNGAGIHNKRQKIIYFNLLSIYGDFYTTKHNLVNCDTGEVSLLHETTCMASDSRYGITIISDKDYTNYPKRVTPSDNSDIGKIRDRECKRLGF